MPIHMPKLTKKQREEWSFFNKKANATELAQEIIRAKVAENTNADAIATKAEQQDLKDLATQVSQLDKRKRKHNMQTDFDRLHRCF